MSKIEVDQITQQSGTTITVGGGACKTAVLDATTVTLGRSGATVSFPAGETRAETLRNSNAGWKTSLSHFSHFDASRVTGVYPDGHIEQFVAPTLL